jgi:MFS superfamily sulfate permease-like transporter
LHQDGTFRDSARFDLPPLHERIGDPFDGSLYFTNAGYFEQAILSRSGTRPEIVYIVVAAHSINDIDASGVESLRNLAERLRQGGVTLASPASSGRYRRFSSGRGDRDAGRGERLQHRTPKQACLRARMAREEQAT